MGFISYVVRCSETKYSSYNQFWPSKAPIKAIKRSFRTKSEAKKCVNYKVNVGIISYVLRCSETEYSSYNRFWPSTASNTAIKRSFRTTSEAKMY